jgi:aminopeptidase-like protein
MKKSLYTLIASLMIISCSPGQEERKEFEFSNDDLLWSLEVLSHDSLEGRGFGTIGNYKAQDFIIEQFERIGVDPAFESGYQQKFEHTLSKRTRQRRFPIENPAEDLSNVADTSLTGGNIVAKIAGQSNKTIVITGHLDHLGILNGEIYNGADDDGSGTATLFSIAQYFKKNSPYYTLIIAAVDGEEIGSPGCTYLAENFPGGIENVVLNVNMDMIAHNDSSELWVAGTFHSPQLKAPLDGIETKLSLLFGHDDPNDESLDDWTRSSDHRIFHELGIPFIYFGVDDHKDYHRSTDTFENINQAFYLDAVALIISAIERYDQNLAPTI